MLGSTDMYQLGEGLQLPKHFQKLPLNFMSAEMKKNWPLPL